MIGAIAAAAALTAPSREVLVERWLRANPAHSAARLDAVPRTASPAKAAVPDLAALARRELGTVGKYQLANPPPVPAAEPWWAPVWRWLADRWQRLWNALFGRVHVGKQQAASIGDGLLVLVALLTLFVGVRLVRNLQLVRSGSRPNAQPLDEPPNPRALYNQACRAAGHADYGTAALLLFAATVAFLDGQGAVAGGSSATVGDLRRELRARNAPLIASFDTVAAPFVQRAYAERAVDEPQWQRARDAFAVLSPSSALRTSAEG